MSCTRSIRMDRTKNPVEDYYPDVFITHASPQAFQPARTPHIHPGDISRTSNRPLFQHNDSQGWHDRPSTSKPLPIQRKSCRNAPKGDLRIYSQPNESSYALNKTHEGTSITVQSNRTPITAAESRQEHHWANNKPSHCLSFSAHQNHDIDARDWLASPELETYLASVLNRTLQEQ